MTDYAKILAASKEGTPVQVITLIDCPERSAGELGRTLVIHPDGTADGVLIDAAFSARLIAYVREAAWNRPEVFQLEEASEYRFFWEEYSKHRRALIFGGGHISLPLVELLSRMDFAVTVVDDRPEFANAARFPWAEAVVCESFTRVLKGDLGIDKNTAVIIVTRGHRYDLDCLKATLAQDSGYIGMIGSKRRTVGIIELIKEEGFSEAAIRRLHAPIGIDIGAATPTEIALSIAAQVVGVFNAASLASLSLQEGC